MKRVGFRAGDWVAVRDQKEILSTLDADGTLGGLPFMPEMLDWCGKTFRVERRVEQICVDFVGPGYANRPFPERDVVLLAGTRCDGRAHDGCARGCKIFWKEAWLRPSSPTEPSAPSSEFAADTAADEVRRRAVLLPVNGTLPRH